MDTNNFFWFHIKIKIYIFWHLVIFLLFSDHKNVYLDNILNNVHIENLVFHKKQFWGYTESSLLSTKTGWCWTKRCFVTIKTSSCSTKNEFMKKIRRTQLNFCCTSSREQSVGKAIMIILSFKVDIFKNKKYWSWRLRMKVTTSLYVVI